MSKLKDLLLAESASSARSTKPGADSFFSRYGLERNPFPASRTIFPEVLYNQDAAVNRFAQSFKELIGDGIQRRAMAVLAGTGGGKTHFLRYCRVNAQEIVTFLNRRLLFVEFQASAGKLQDVVREILLSADGLCQREMEQDFVTCLVQNLRDSLLDGVQQDDLRTSLKTLSEASKPGYKCRDRAGVYTFEVLREIFRRWISGGTLSQTERKYLGVISRIATGAMAARVTTEWLKLSRTLNLFEGVVLFLDEVETLFSTTPSHYQSFLQDLRYLYDESLKDGSGYSLLLVAASTPNGANILRQANYPVFQRLGFETDQRIELQPIADMEEARRFAETYIQYERSRTGAKLKKGASFPEILTEEDIRTSYQAALGPSSSVLRSGRVNQAQLLDALHQLIERKRAA